MFKSIDVELGNNQMAYKLKTEDFQAMMFLFWSGMFDFGIVASKSFRENYRWYDHLPKLHNDYKMGRVFFRRNKTVTENDEYDVNMVTVRLPLMLLMPSGFWTSFSGYLDNSFPLQITMETNPNWMVYKPCCVSLKWNMKTQYSGGTAYQPEDTAINFYEEGWFELGEKQCEGVMEVARGNAQMLALGTNCFGVVPEFLATGVVTTTIPGQTAAVLAASMQKMDDRVVLQNVFLQLHLLMVDPVFQPFIDSQFGDNATNTTKLQNVETHLHTHQHSKSKILEIWNPTNETNFGVSYDYLLLLPVKKSNLDIGNRSILTGLTIGDDERNILASYFMFGDHAWYQYETLTVKVFDRTGSSQQEWSIGNGVQFFQDAYERFKTLCNAQQIPVIMPETSDFNKHPVQGQVISYEEWLRNPFLVVQCHKDGRFSRGLEYAPRTKFQVSVEAERSRENNDTTSANPTAYDVTWITIQLMSSEIYLFGSGLCTYFNRNHKESAADF
jgi:hypothetical protein